MTEWFLAEVEGDESTHAASQRVTRCGKAVSFPMGEGWPTCPTCLAAVPLPTCAKCGRTPRGGILDDDGTGQLVCYQATSDESWQECYPPDACL